VAAAGLARCRYSPSVAHASVALPASGYAFPCPGVLFVFRPKEIGFYSVAAMSHREHFGPPAELHLPYFRLNFLFPNLDQNWPETAEFLKKPEPGTLPDRLR